MIRPRSLRLGSCRSDIAVVVAVLLFEHCVLDGPLTLEPPDGSTTDGLSAVRRRAIDAVRAEDPVRAEFTKDFLG